MLIRFDGVVKDILPEYALSLIERGLAEKVITTEPEPTVKIIKKERKP